MNNWISKPIKSRVGDDYDDDLTSIQKLGTKSFRIWWKSIFQFVEHVFDKNKKSVMMGIRKSVSVRDMWNVVKFYIARWNMKENIRNITSFSKPTFIIFMLLFVCSPSTCFVSTFSYCLWTFHRVPFINLIDISTCVYFELFRNAFKGKWTRKNWVFPKGDLYRNCVTCNDNQGQFLKRAKNRKLLWKLPKFYECNNEVVKVASHPN